MTNRLHREESGAVLVQIALLMVALLLFVALAIDVGHVYAERRRMQNAADAGALAGAHELCFGDPTYASISFEARNYAINGNGAQSADVIWDGGTQVQVTAGETVDLYFGAIIGMATMRVQAEATAACGETTRFCGTWPLAFPKAVWDTIPLNQEFYVWDDANFDEVPTDLCAHCNCVGAPYGNGSIGPGQRGWIRLSSPSLPPGYSSPCGSNCGASSLKCWLENDYNGEINLPACIPGKPGVSASALKNGGAEARIGDELRIMLWDGECPGGSQQVGTCPGDLYRVVAVGCIELIEIDLKLTLDKLPGSPKYDCPKNAKVMRARKVACSNEPCGRTNGDPITAGGLGAVSLVY